MMNRQRRKFKEVRALNTNGRYDVVSDKCICGFCTVQEFGVTVTTSYGHRKLKYG